MAEKSLPITIDVPSKADVYITQRLSILCANTINMQSLFMNKFVQLFLRSYYYPDGGLDDMVTFYTDAVFLWGGLSFEFNDEDIPFKDIINHIRTQINNNQYVSIFLNDYYVEGSRRKRHFDHEYLIVGYNDEKKEFDTVLYNRFHRYDHVPVKYSELEDGYRHRVAPSFTYLTMQCQQGYDHLKDDDREKTILLLNDYVYSNNSFDWYLAPGKTAFGMDVYDAVIDKTLHYHSRNCEQVVDMRDYSILVEHKNFMYQRIHDYFGLERLAEKYMNIVNESQEIKFLAMKCAFGNKCNYLDDIAKLLDKMHMDESILLHTLLAAIN